MTTITKLHLNWSDYDIGLNSSNAWTTWQVLTKTAWGAEWANASWWDIVVSSQANNTLTTGAGLRAWTEANYSSLTKDSNTIYFVY